MQAVTVEELPWGGPPAAGAPFEAVVGADVVYDEDMFEPLARTLQGASDAQTRVYLSVFDYPEYAGMQLRWYP